MHSTDPIIDMLWLSKDSKDLSKGYSTRTSRNNSTGIVRSTDSNIFVMDESFEGLDAKICNYMVQIILKL